MEGLCRVMMGLRGDCVGVIDALIRACEGIREGSCRVMEGLCRGVGGIVYGYGGLYGLWKDCVGVMEGLCRGVGKIV